jgi:alkylation response protein AidB-like acyl-CoA dehydrogenase
MPGYADLDPDFTAAVLDEAGKLAQDVLAPLNAVGDREGCKLENGIVYTPTGFKAAFEAMKDGGWNGLDLPEEFGGQNLPYVMGWRWARCSFGQHGLQHVSGPDPRRDQRHPGAGSDEQRRPICPRWCRWTGPAP